MFTFESVEKFIAQRLNWASQNPKNALTMEAQAFGCLQFVCEQVWQSQPELEAKLIQTWNDNWHNLFAQIYLES